ncbi:MAG: hypothetical protein ACKOUR_06775 [Planctomycetota bacterium]
MYYGRFLFSTNGQAIWVWMTLLAILNLAAIVLLLLAPRLVPRPLQWLSRGVLALTLLGFLSDLLRDNLHSLQAFGELAHTWLLIIAVAGIVLLQRAEIHLRSQQHWQRWLSPMILTTLSVLTLLGCAWRFQIHDQRECRMWASEDGPVVPHWVSIRDSVAVTDSGHEFPLFQFDVPEEASMTSVETLGGDISEKVILVNDEDSTANCHGWVFTHGHYMIRGEWVDMILKDNGYEVVEEPQVDDLIIYRSDDGVPVHTGLVKAIGKDHFVLIESKWGGMPTYLHLPEDQVYSAHFSYYRSARDGHQVRIMPRQATPAKFTAQLPVKTAS